MLSFQIHVSNEIRGEINKTYGKDDYNTVSVVLSDIIGRYFNIEYFNPNLIIEDEDVDYIVCEFCGEKAKRNKLLDVDGMNLVECDVCDNCGSGMPCLE